MNRKPFTPQPGTGYWNQGGGTFDCLSVLDDELDEQIEPDY